MLKEKVIATSLHLVISTIILFSALAVILFIWYPSPYSEISGLHNLIFLLIGVDLILGPLLTFIIFKKNKPSLQFDLSIIASIQIAALSYGIYAIHQAHPAYVVYAVDRFELISAQEALPERAKYKEFQISTLGFPKLAYAKIPEDKQARNQLLFEVLSGLPDLERRPEYYEPIEKYLHKILERSLNPQKLFHKPEQKEKLLTFLDKYQVPKENIAFFPLVGKVKDVLMVISKDDGRIIGTIDIYPWDK